MKDKTFSLLNIKANETYRFERIGMFGLYNREDYIAPLAYHDSGGMKDRELVNPLLKSKISIVPSIQKCVDKKYKLK